MALTILFLGFLSYTFLQLPVLASVLLALFLFVYIFIFFPKTSLLIFLFFLIFQNVITFLTKIGVVFSLDELIILNIFVLLLVKKIILKEPFILEKIFIPVFFLIGFGLVSTVVYKLVPFGVALGGMLLFLKGFILYLIILNIRITEQNIQMLARILAVLGIVAVGYGILGIVYPGIFLNSLGIEVQKRYGFPAMQSFLGHPGSFAALIGILFCFSYSKALLKQSKRQMLLSIIYIIAIIFSFRRTTLVGVLLAVSSFWFFSGIKKQQIRKNTLTSVGVIFVILILFSGVISVSYRDLVDSYFKKDSPRSLLFRTGFKIGNDYFPLGAGFGTFSGGINQKYYSPLFYKYRLNNIHGLSARSRSFINDTFWPHVVAEVGYFGLLIYLWIIALFFSICFKAMKTFVYTEKMVFVQTATMMLILSMVESLKATFYETSVWVLFYFGSIAVLHGWLIREAKNDNPAIQ